MNSRREEPCDGDVDDNDEFCRYKHVCVCAVGFIIIFYSMRVVRRVDAHLSHPRHLLLLLRQANLWACSVHNPERRCHRCRCRIYGNVIYTIVDNGRPLLKSRTRWLASLRGN